MNRNVESHFAENPTSLDVSRSMFDRSSSVKFSANVGELIPFYVDEVLPGDTFQIETSKIVRLQTLLHPIMDNMYLDTYWFFVPNRLVWDHWKNFMGESNRAWTPSVTYAVPKISIPSAHPGVGSLADYMGIPLNVDVYSDGVNALPFRAYAKICEDWFRSQWLTDPLVIPTGDSTVTIGSKSDADIYCANGGTVFHACKYHDYFTSCSISTQFGDAVRIPTRYTNGQAKVGVGTDTHDGVVYGTNKMYLMRSKNAENQAYRTELHSVGGAYTWQAVLSDDESTSTYYRPINLWAQIGSALGSINDLRIAFQVQKFLEKQLRGTRYIEVLKSQFGVTSPDARLQRSEYLGGNRIPLSVHEVTNNTAGENDFLGDLGAMSRTVDVHDDFVHSFTEHGFVIGLMVVRYDHTYGQGLERFWLRNSIYDYYFPVFANIGEQAVTTKEIFWQPGLDSEGERIFGYQEAWADYRFKFSRVAGEMRPEADNTLASWHLADAYDPVGEPPTLSDSWIREDPANVDRTLAVTSSVANQYFVDCFIKNICTRVMPVYSIPGLADHH